MRFPEFEKGKPQDFYKRYLFTDIFAFSTGKNIKQQEAHPDFKIPCVRYGELYHMYNEVIYKVINRTNFDKSELRFSEGNEILLPSAGEDPLDIGSASALTIANVAIGRTINILSPLIKDVYSQIYVSYYINQKFRRKISTLAKGFSISNVYNSDLKKLEILLPSLPEQQKIANCLLSLDNQVTAETEKLDHLKNHKKGLLQRLFPAKGETKPQFRFPEFKNDGDWKKSTLEDCLDYLQPIPYLVNSTDYDDNYEIPVLTAGKTFILGYTDEKEGIFNENLPVIIFDDFTTASKFVDFAFKAKSSAMKILLAKKDNNIKFLFEAIQNIQFEVGSHQRHWISVYSKLNF